MKINADFTKRVIVHGDSMPWIESPMAGVHRRMFDRIGDEVARATSIVRYAPDSHFAPHVHDGGEEFIVLEGVFQDEHGDYPAGSYIRNPPTSSHRPGSTIGCMIFVKLWQFNPDDRCHVNIDMNNIDAWGPSEITGVTQMILFENANEIVSTESWAADTNISMAMPNGAEIFVLDGGFSENGDVLSRYSWLRIPPHGMLHAVAGANGARIWMKRGHLGQIRVQP